jgi:hypothetical protein
MMGQPGQTQRLLVAGGALIKQEEAPGGAGELNDSSISDPLVVSSKVQCHESRANDGLP